MEASFAARLFLATVGAFGICGCEPAATPAKPTTAASPAAASHEHGHALGPHEGAIADWGGGKFHAEFTVDHNKKEATVYILGSDEKTQVPIKATKILLNIKQPTFQVVLAAKPMDGEQGGLSSRFVGIDDRLGVVQEFVGKIAGEVDGVPYSGEFAEEAHGAHDHK